MQVEIPNYGEVRINTLVCDYNGTLAVDGQLSSGVKERLAKLGQEMKIIVVTADTHGTVAAACEGLPVEIWRFPDGAVGPEKARILKEMGQYTAALGNGRNDDLMMEAAQLAICILGVEGAWGPLLAKSDMVVPSAEMALDLFLKPSRIKAGLRG